MTAKRWIIAVILVLGTTVAVFFVRNRMKAKANAALGKSEAYMGGCTGHSSTDSRSPFVGSPCGASIIGPGHNIDQSKELFVSVFRLVRCNS